MKQYLSIALVEASASAWFFFIASFLTVVAMQLDLSVVPVVPVWLLSAILAGLIWRSALTSAVALAGPYGAGHCNFGVTLSMAALGQMPWAQVPSFFVAQFAGAFAGLMLSAVALMRGPFDKEFHSSFVVWPEQEMTLFSSFFWQVFSLEGALMFALALGVPLFTAKISNDRREWAIAAGRIGGILGFGVFAISPVTGGSINPTRFLAPLGLARPDISFLDLVPGLVAYVGATVIAGLLAGLAAKGILSSQA